MAKLIPAALSRKNVPRRKYIIYSDNKLINFPKSSNWSSSNACVIVVLHLQREKLRYSRWRWTTSWWLRSSLYAAMMASKSMEIRARNDRSSESSEWWTTVHHYTMEISKKPEEEGGGGSGMYTWKTRLGEASTSWASTSASFLRGFSVAFKFIDALLLRRWVVLVPPLTSSSFSIRWIWSLKAAACVRKATRLAGWDSRGSELGSATISAYSFGVEIYRMRIWFRNSSSHHPLYEQPYVHTPFLYLLCFSYFTVGNLQYTIVISLVQYITAFDYIL